MRPRVLFLTVVAAALLVPQVADACPVCYGDIDGPAARGVNNGVLTMLGVVFGLQVCFGVMFVGMMRRAKRDTDNNESPEASNMGGE
ncbi:MAG: hypothetical protein GKS06_01225 [Acidobacteria bacterium]|nr:hypothetical protein [Acidobacteriota bacterium]